jgi:GNAT superfamily N-acetyltransferase
MPNPASSLFKIRQARAEDAPLIARHRARMFQDMGEVPPTMVESLIEASLSWTERALDAGEYVGWLASPAQASHMVVGGAGVQLRRAAPHLLYNERGDVTIAKGAHAIVLNAFVEPEWRRHGVGTLLMQHVIDWAQNEQLDRLVLHSSRQGRELYERLGFVPTNEMQYRKYR